MDVIYIQQHLFKMVTTGKGVKQGKCSAYEDDIFMSKTVICFRMEVIYIGRWSAWGLVSMPWFDIKNMKEL